MDHRDINWADALNNLGNSPRKAKPGSEESRAMWDKRAPSFARKAKRSDYIDRLLELLAPRNGEVVLDFGCGSGTLSIPLALRGNHVIACDFSPVMLEQLEEACEHAGVVFSRENSAPESAGAVESYLRSWQESWDDLPVADVAISSRSLITDDIDDSIGKLEAHARKRVAITVGVGGLHFHDPKIFEAMGKDASKVTEPEEVVCIMNYLFARGRLPRLDYIECHGVHQRKTKEELLSTLIEAHSPENEAERAAAAAYIESHIVYDASKDLYEMDYPKNDLWAYIEWDVPSPRD